jgi:hypothetical protein
MERIPPAPVIPIRQIPFTPPPPDAPRTLTMSIRRSVLLEPRVRRWWLLAILIALLFCGYAGDRLWARRVEAQLIHNGTPMHAKISGAENKITGMPIGPGDLVQLELNWPDNTQEHVTGHLSTKSVVGDDVDIHVDPADHSNWTDRTQPISLLDSLVIGLFVLPLIPVVLVAGYAQANTLMNLWKSGAVAVAVIYDRKQSPIAPLSYALRCSLQNNRQKTLFTVFVPRIGYGLEKGDLIWVITPPKKGRPLAVLWTAGGST